MVRCFRSERVRIDIYFDFVDIRGMSQFFCFE
jgi:hypothetical protein